MCVCVCVRLVCRGVSLFQSSLNAAGADRLMWPGTDRQLKSVSHVLVEGTDSGPNVHQGSRIVGRDTHTHTHTHTHRDSYFELMENSEFHLS